MKKLIFVHISIFCILFACHGKGLQSRHKSNNDSNKDCRTASVVVDCLEVDKVMGLVGTRSERTRTRLQGERKKSYCTNAIP